MLITLVSTFSTGEFVFFSSFHVKIKLEISVKEKKHYGIWTRGGGTFHCCLMDQANYFIKITVVGSKQQSYFRILHITHITYMMLFSSSSWASLRCRTRFTVPTSSVTVLPRSASSSATLVCSSSSGSTSTAFKFFLGVMTAMRVKALVSLNKLSHCGSGVSREDSDLQLRFSIDWWVCYT